MRQAVVRALLVVAGLVYGFVGAGSLIPFVMFLAYGPPLTGEHFSIPLLIVYVFPLVNAAVGGSLAYAFLRLRWWGRHLAILYNSAWLLANAIGVVQAQLVEHQQLTGRAVMFAVATVGFLLGTVILCLSREARQLMSKSPASL